MCLLEAGAYLDGRDDSDTRVPIGTWIHKALSWSRPQKAFTAPTYKIGATSGSLKGNS